MDNGRSPTNPSRYCAALRSFKLLARVARAATAAVKGVRLGRRRREERLRCLSERGLNLFRGGGVVRLLGAAGALEGAALARGWAMRIEVRRCGVRCAV